MATPEPTTPTRAPISPTVPARVAPTADASTFPRPLWVSLVSADGRLVARFDKKRGILEVVRRGEKEYFDLAELVYNQDAPILVVSANRVPPP